MIFFPSSAVIVDSCLQLLHPQPIDKLPLKVNLRAFSANLSAYMYSLVPVNLITHISLTIELWGRGWFQSPVGNDWWVEQVH